MPDRPLLLLGVPAPAPRQPGPPRIPPQPHFPPVNRQTERLGPKFERLKQVIEYNNRKDAVLQLDSTDIAPDRALVFEVAGNLSDFASQAERVGFTFLGELDSEFDPDEDFYFAKTPDKAVTARLYLVMPDLLAMNQMLSLWNQYSKGEDFERGSGLWKNLFSKLHDLRPWGPQDRLTEGFLHAFKDWVCSGSLGPFRFEVDLWFSHSDSHRGKIKQDILQSLAQVEGQILHESFIPAIRYHGLLVEIPKTTISTDPYSLPLSFSDPIMCLNPQAMGAFDSHEVLGKIEPFETTPELNDTPIAALLDGFPMANHSCLEGKIIIEDFLDIEEKCPAADRHHGTAMSSLIINGDMHDLSEEKISQKLIVLPILYPDPLNGKREITLEDKLIIDIIYQAVLRLKENINGQEPVGQQVIVINHSIADLNTPYVGRISAWARLLDYLSFRYGLLFIVSAGNYTHTLPIPDCARMADLEDAPPANKMVHYHKALACDMRNRQVYSPAEALNPITVGAWHSDKCDCTFPLPSYLHDVLPSQDGPSIISAIGLGHKRSVKPDLFYDGGRVLARLMPNGGSCALSPVVQPTQYSGQKVAAPSNSGDMHNITNTCGTSNAAALITRKAIQLNNMLNTLENDYFGVTLPNTHRAVMIKALLAHGCRWDDESQCLEQAIEPQDSKKWEQRRTNIARLKGFGKPDIDRVIACTSQRATMIGQETLTVNQSHHFEIPLPGSLSNFPEFRRLTITVAWMSPVNARNLAYRQAVLETNVGFKKCGTERMQFQAPINTIGRGTLLHNVYEGSKGVALDDKLILEVTCREQAGKLDDPIHYAIAVSFEVGEASSINVYEEIRNKLPIRLREAVVV